MKVSSLKKNPKNPRQIRGEKLELLKKSVATFQKMMELRPIVIDEDNVVLGGNMRLAAIKALGLKDIPDEWVKQASDLTEDEKREFIIKDNAGFGEWDYDAMANEWDAGELTDWGLDVLGESDQQDKRWDQQITEDTSNPEGDGVAELTGHRLSSLWYGMKRENDLSPYMLDLPYKPNLSAGNMGQLRYSRTNPEATERIVRTYMREGDLFFEQCCGWMTFSSTAKYFGFSGKGGDIWETSLNFCKQQLAKMPGSGKVEAIYADCRNTGEPSGHYDFVHSNPPFFNLEPYGESNDDLAAQGSYERWLTAMGDMGKEAERILKPGGVANFVINDMREKGVLVLMHADFIKAIQSRTALQLHDLVVSEVLSQALKFRKHDYERRRTVKCHEYIITFKKDVESKAISRATEG